MKKAIYRNNLRLKKQFREWLIKYGEGKDKNKEDFVEIVRTIGHAWGVARTVRTKDFDQFAGNLFDNYEKIKTGEYDWNGTWESKICFLISPEHYKLICDSQIRESITTIVKNNKIATHLSKSKIKSINSNLKWKPLVDDFYKLIENSTEYDRIDALMWMGEVLTNKEDLHKIMETKE